MSHPHLNCTDGEFICTGDCDKEQYRSLHFYYLIGAGCTLCGSAFVILTYLFSPSLRTHPSVLLFGRCIFDFGFGLSFLTLYFFATNDLNDLLCQHSVCAVMGPFNLFVFLCSQGYFLSLLIDLYLSISNPFLSPSSYTNIMHSSIILIATISIIIVRIFWRFGFHYNPYLQYCSIAPTENDEDWNIFNWIFIYGPTVFCMFASVCITFYAFGRLTKGLPNTFFIRIKALKDTLSYSFIFTVYFLIVGTCYFITWNKSIDPKNDDLWFKIYAISSSLLGAVDCIVWLSRKCICFNKEYFKEVLSTKHTKHRANKTVGISRIHRNGQGLPRPHRESSTSTVGLLENSNNDNDNDNDNVINNNNNLRLSVTGTHSHSKSRSRFSNTPSTLQPALPDRVFNEFVTETEDGSGDEDDTSKRRKKKSGNCCKRMSARFGIKQQSNSAMINKALRREILAYTTDGIAQSALKAKESVNKIDKFSDLKSFYYPLHINDTNAVAIRDFKISIKHNITLLNTTQSQLGNNIDGRFCCCFKVENNGIDSSKTTVSGNKNQNTITEISNLISSKSVTSSGNKQREREFIDYAPLLFRYVRNHIIGISDFEYIQSIIPQNEEDQLKVLDVKYGEGKSGAFFYFTWDSRFIVKTLSKQEVKYLLSFLENYISHLEKNRNTILSRIVGIHSCKFYNVQKHFIVMENVFLGELKPNEVYDLKGSWEGRFTKNSSFLSGKVMKDLDLKRYIILTKKTRTKIIKQLEMDTQFLCDNNIMDYSMLLGIYYMKIVYKDNDNYESDNEDESKYNEYLENEDDIYGGVRASLIEGPGIYYFGIIDAIQKYTFRKRLETWFRRWIQRKNVKGISCVDPELYKKRFMKYMKSIMISNDKYYKQLNLSTNRFGDENVLIYPPRKLLYHNMRILRERKQSMIYTDTNNNNIDDKMVTISTFNQTMMDNTINSENEDDGEEIYDINPSIKISKTK